MISCLYILKSLLIAAGSFGNLLVLSAVARQPLLRTVRNAFIINLAVSDLLLCLVTTPLTLIEILNNHWPFGDSVITCKASGGLQSVSVFVSTLSITAIALDRYQLIVYPTRNNGLKKIGAATGLLIIWVLGFLFASPIFVFRSLERQVFGSKSSPSIDGSNSPGGVRSIDYW